MFGTGGAKAIGGFSLEVGRTEYASCGPVDPGAAVAAGDGDGLSQTIAQRL